jgi:hypothetical protein
MPTNSKEMQRKYSATYRIKRKQLGLCRLCNKKSLGKNYCLKHLHEHNKRIKAKRVYKKKRGICIHCNEPVCYGSKSACVKHMKGWSKTPTSKYTRLKGSARIRGIAFSLTKDEFNTWYRLQSKTCFYCGITEDVLSRHINKREQKLTIDRKNNSQGYCTENICLSCFRCNNLKSDFFKCDDWLKIADQFIKPRLGDYHNKCI